MAQATATNPRYEYWRWRIFGITWLAYASYYLTRKSFSVAKIGISNDPSMSQSKIDMTNIDNAALIAYALGQFVWGLAGDRLGTRRVVLFGMFGSVVAASLMGASTATVVFGGYSFLLGLFQSTGWAPLTKNVGNFFSRSERGTVFGMWSTNYALGGWFASAYAGFWGDQLGWRYAFIIPAITLAVVAVLFWLFQRNRPEDVGLESIEAYHGEPLPPEGDSASAAKWSDTWAIISNRTVLLMGLVYFMLKQIRYVILLWGPKYVNEKIGTQMTGSGLISGVFEFAGILSALSAGIISDRVFGTRRIPVCVISLFALGLFLQIFDRLPATPFWLCAGFFVIGLLLFGPDSILAGVAAADFGSKRGTATAAGWINGWGSVGAVMGIYIAGNYSDSWGWSTVYSLFGAMILLSAVLLVPKWNAVPHSTAEKKNA